MPALAHDFSCHCYADEVQLLLSFPPVDTHVSAQIAACLADMSSWRAAHHLKLNPWKTELPYIPGDTSPHLRSCNLLGELLVKAIVLFSYCSLQSCRFLIYNIKRIWSRYLFSLSSSKDWTNSAHPWLGFPWIPSNPCNWSRMQLLYLFLISHITPLKHWCLPIKSKNRPAPPTWRCSSDSVQHPVISELLAQLDLTHRPSRYKEGMHQGFFFWTSDCCPNSWGTGCLQLNNEDLGRI